jgi:hypothetical protein
MAVANLVLDYLRVILAWPFMAMVTVLVGLIIFKEDIRLLMTRIAKIRFPGGSELSTQQLEPDQRGKDGSNRDEIPDVEVNEIDTLLQELESTQQQREAIRQLYSDERANAYIWEYRYLNHFLASHTLQVLNWLSTLNTPTSYSLFDNIWAQASPVYMSAKPS